MKQKCTKIITIIIALILVIGTIMIVTKGLHFDLKYQNNKKIEINLGKEFDKKEVENIVKEVVGEKPVDVSAIEVYKDAISITTTELSDEQKNQIVAKINEKYATDLVAEDITIEENSHIRGRDILKPYITPFTILTIIVLVYLSIRYFKLNAFKVCAQSFVIICFAQLVLLAVMAVTRMPIGICTIPAVLVVYVISTYICTARFDKKMEALKVENK